MRSKKILPVVLIALLAAGLFNVPFGQKTASAATAKSSRVYNGSSAYSKSGSIVYNFYYVDPLTGATSLMNTQTMRISTTATMDSSYKTKATTWNMSLTSPGNTSAPYMTLSQSSGKTEQVTEEGAANHPDEWGEYNYLRAKFKMTIPAYYKIQKRERDIGGELDPEGMIKFTTTTSATSQLGSQYGLNDSASNRGVTFYSISNLASYGAVTARQYWYKNSQYNYYFTKTTSTQTFDKNGGGNTESKKLISGTSLSAPSAGSKPGYHFTSWSPSVPSIVPLTNATYKAQWAANTYVVRYNANGASGSVPNNQQVTYNSGQKAAKNINLSKKDEVFIGWNTKKDGTGSLIEPGDDVSHLTTSNKVVYDLYATFQNKDETKIWNAPASQTINFGGQDIAKTKETEGIKITVNTVGKTIYLQKNINKKWTTLSSQSATVGTKNYKFKYPYASTSGDYRVLVTGSNTTKPVASNIKLTVHNPKSTLKVTGKNLTSTGHSWKQYPVKYKGKGKYNGSTTKDIRKTKKFKDGTNYNVKWDENHKTTTVVVNVSKAYNGQTVTWKDSARHRTWKKSHKSHVEKKTTTVKDGKIEITLNKKLLEYENHTFSLTSHVKTDSGKKKVGSIKFHIHVKDKGEQIVDTAVKFLGKVSYNQGTRDRIIKSAKSLSWLKTHKPSKTNADCSSFVTRVYRLHGLWTGTCRGDGIKKNKKDALGRTNSTASMGMNAGKHPKGMKNKVKRQYKNMGCVWLVNGGESGHSFAHTALIVGNNYYINVTNNGGSIHQNGRYKSSCFQRCTNGSRNFGIKEVYNYRSW